LSPSKFWRIPPQELIVAYRISWQDRPNGQHLDGRIAVLEDGRGSGLEVWPALGFNAYRWHVQTAELLYADPQLFDNGRPTRSGIPILFPFPNRIRGGTFTYNGKTYQLPLNDPAKKNAIHGFACRHPWRVVDEGATADSAWLTGEFQLSRDAPADLPLWPADACLRITYRLMENRLRIEAAVDAPAEALPFGLGYHPYFAVAPFGGEQATVLVPATRSWVLDENLPTGVQHAVEGTRDLRRGRPLAELNLDDVLTGLPAPPADALSGLGLGGILRHPTGSPALRLYGSADFTEVVVFTPPHRQAVCLEPYTCTTDAANLSNAGWRVLPAGQSWQGVVELLYDARSSA
jgi:aldose 1-epimerase